MLKAERIARLDAIGFEWEEPDRFGRSREEKWENLWERMFLQMAEHQRLHGHCHVVSGNKENPQLSEWVASQRKVFKQGQMRADRAERLNALGFIWRSDYQTWKRYRGGEVRAARQKIGDAQEVRWNQRYEELVTFKKLHGHTRVPKVPPGNRVLWHWRHVQREWRRKGILKPGRLARLDAIGFEWEEPPGKSPSVADYWEPRWNAMFERLKAFQERFGHARVPKRWKEDPSLANWVHKQRREIRRGKITAEHRARLEALGFQSGKPSTRLPRKAGKVNPRWTDRLEKLRQFQECFGHTRVPRRWREDRGLGEWVRAQRRAGRRNQLKPERKAQLESLGFEWSTTTLKAL
jgi:hypothetical protein